MSMMNYAQSWLDLERTLGGRMVMAGTPAEIRAMYAQSVAMMRPHLPPPSDAVESKDGAVDGIKYRLYTPKAASKQGPLPVAIWTHGGGWMVGDLDTDDVLCRTLAEHVPSIIVNIDYRLSPEYKLPTQLQDVLAVYKWARENAAAFGGDPKRFYTIGGSVGGALALQVANQDVKDGRKDGIKGVAAIVPCTLHWDNVPEEYRSMYTSYEENKTGVPMIDKNTMDIFYTHVVDDPKDSDIFTALATENHHRYPPVYFVSCEKDPLRDDAYVMEAALKKAGVSTKHDHYNGIPHYFWVFPSVPESKQFVANLIGGVMWLIAQM